MRNLSRCLCRNHLLIIINRHIFTIIALCFPREGPTHHPITIVKEYSKLFLQYLLQMII